MSNLALKLKQAPEVVLYEALPPADRKRIFPKGIVSVRKITGDILLREKLHERYRNMWGITKELLRWKEKEGFCASSVNPDCENRLTEKDRQRSLKSCSECARLRQKYARGEGRRKNHSPYGMWRAAQRALEAAEKRRLKGR